MIFRDISVVTTGAVAIGRIDVVRMHAAEVYVAPAIGELFECRYWHNQAGSFFYGHWVDVERAHAMLATIRSAMERDFLHFSEDGTGRDHPRILAASFSRGMGQRLSARLRRLKAGRKARLLAHGKDTARELVRRCQRTLAKAIGRRAPASGTLAYAAGVEAGDRVALSHMRRGSSCQAGGRLGATTPDCRGKFLCLL
jgi:hypothetical protein